MPYTLSGEWIETGGCSEWSCPHHGEENRRKFDEDRAKARRIDETVDSLAEAFKAGWHRADTYGLSNRTHYGIRNVLGTLGLIPAGDPA